jgi:hypothetical protein
MYGVPQAGLTLHAGVGRLERGVRQHCVTLGRWLEVRRMPGLTAPKQLSAASCSGTRFPAATGSAERRQGGPGGGRPTN